MKTIILSLVLLLTPLVAKAQSKELQASSIETLSMYVYHACNEEGYHVQGHGKIILVCEDNGNCQLWFTQVVSK